MGDHDERALRPNLLPHFGQLASGQYLAAFLAAQCDGDRILFRDLNFRAASGGRLGLFGDPRFLATWCAARAA